MSRPEGSGLFRGSEFSKLLILAGLVVVGWPAVFYYGLRPEPPKAAGRGLIAAIPALPQADPAPELAGILDKEPRSFRDEAALKYLLDRLRATAPQTLAAEARRDVLPVDLLRKARRYRGLPIHLDGFASRVFALDDQDAELSPNRRLYEVWVRPADHDQRLYPICAILEQAPPTLPGGRDIDEPVAFDGYFLKLLAYRAGDTMRYAPMLVGRMAHTPTGTEPFKAGRSRFWTYLPVALLMMYVTGRLFFQLRKKLPSLAHRTRPVPPKDEITPDELHEWLAGPEPEQDDDPE